MKIQKIVSLFLSVVFTVVCGLAHAQNPTDDLPGDPGGIYVTITKVQDLSFGSFAVSGNGGSVTIAPNGSRTAAGSIMLLNIGTSFFGGIFDLEAPEGSIITIMQGPDVILSGSNGGSVTLRVNTSSPASPFTTTAVSPSTTEVRIGGKLTIGSATVSPPGQYNGTFEVSVDYQ